MKFILITLLFFPVDKKSSSKRKVRSAGSPNKYLEAALVTDETMSEKYGESKISTLMLTIANIVSKCFAFIVISNLIDVLRRSVDNSLRQPIEATN